MLFLNKVKKSIAKSKEVDTERVDTPWSLSSDLCHTILIVDRDFKGSDPLRPRSNAPGLALSVIF